VAAVWEALRPRQWTKNLIVFAGLLFSRHAESGSAVALAVLGFVAFCGLSSAGYLFNDILDAAADRGHPVKQQRPVASGRLHPSNAAATALVLTGAGLGLAAWINLEFGLIAFSYLLLNAFYTLGLKHIVILDVIVLALGFVLRAAAGAAAVRVPISPWLLICTFMLALFLAMSKRRHELVLLEADASAHRASLGEYSTYLLDQMISVVTASTVIAYSLYTLSPETVQRVGYWMVATVPPVLYGIFRYLYLVHQRGEGSDPDRILVRDLPLIAGILVWLAIVIVVLYWRPPGEWISPY
jgi:4-hydroxybenzoate polyprenyltransferase